ncbi:MAG: STAS/SEC14 domain-containing protein [Marinilabiliaceae bacterium]|nr:STAS/SEC14 domain-containing protein [Marinilabiliaceae bacterium]
MNSYKIIPELKLVIEFYSGKIRINDFIELIEKEVKDERFNSKYNTIVSIDQADVDLINFSEAKNWVESVRSFEDYIGRRKFAIVTSSIKQVIISTMFVYEAKILPMQIKVFSSIEAALRWNLINSEEQSPVIKKIEMLRLCNVS